MNQNLSGHHGFRSNVSQLHDAKCALESFQPVVNLYIVPILSFFGIVFNAFCVLIFSLILLRPRTTGKKSVNVCRYLLAKSCHDTVHFLIQIFSPFYYWEHSVGYQSYSVQIWYIWFYYYIESINELCSGFLELAACVDCFLTIKNKLEALRSRKVCYFYIAFTLVFSSLFYIFRLYEFEIIEITPKIVATPRFNSTTKASNLYKTQFSLWYQSQVFKVFLVLHTVLRDFLVVITLIVINVFILLKLRKSLSNKKRLINPIKSSTPVSPGTVSAKVASSVDSTNASSSSSSRLLANVHNAEKKTTIMVVLSGINYIIGHIFLIIFYIGVNDSDHFWSCYYTFTSIPFYISYIMPIFIYALNNSFKSQSVLFFDSCMKRARDLRSLFEATCSRIRNRVKK